jgi:hypothetical protein
VRLVDDQQRGGSARVNSNCLARLEDLHGGRRPANLDILADEAERHAVLAPLERHQAINPDPARRHGVERVRQRLGKRGQPHNLLLPRLGDARSGRGTATLMR